MMLNGAELLVKCLEAQGVEVIFGIPGAKIDSVFNALVDSSIRLVVCRHEQNAAFMAASYGRLTGMPGVVLVTSGPGVSNLATGLLTATTEGDPIIAIGGNVSRGMSLKASHQNTNNVKLLEAVTKSSVEVTAPENIPEAIANAFRLATTPHRGVCFISLPQDVCLEKTATPVIKPKKDENITVADDNLIKIIAEQINQAKCPVLLLGEEASQPDNTKAIRELLAKTKLPTVGTFQAAGVVPRELVSCFAGRVGLFHNQPGDKLLNLADLIITIGFNPVEYDPEVWNEKSNTKIIHIHDVAAEIRNSYQPEHELLGSIPNNLNKLIPLINEKLVKQAIKHVEKFHTELEEILESGQAKTGSLIHPLKFIYELRHAIDDDTLVVCDIGTVYMWMARYFLSYQPRHLLFSNGQQTLGVALPWAIGASYALPNKKIISMSGDGGFLFSATELETAVREKLHFVHFVWSDGTYNMVLEQEVMKYRRKSGVDLGHVDLVHFAAAFGAKGYQLKSANDLPELLKSAMSEQVPVLIDVPIDYRDNPGLFKKIDINLAN